MTLDTLIAQPADFGSEAAFMEQVLDQYNDEGHAPASRIEEMFVEAARTDLRLALPRYTRAPISWEGYNESIADATHEPQWRYLLSRRQLELLYRWLDEGEGSLNRSLWRHYAKEYSDALSGIWATINGSGGTSTSRTVTVGL